MGEWDVGGHGCVGGVPCTYAHTCTCMLNMINMINMDASMSAAICYFYTCVCVLMRVCACMW